MDDDLALHVVSAYVSHLARACLREREKGYPHHRPVMSFLLFLFLFLRIVQSPFHLRKDYTELFPSFFLLFSLFPFSVLFQCHVHYLVRIRERPLWKRSVDLDFRVNLALGRCKGAEGMEATSGGKWHKDR